MDESFECASRTVSAGYIIHCIRAVAKEALQEVCNGLNLPTKGVVIGCGHYN